MWVAHLTAPTHHIQRLHHPPPQLTPPAHTHTPQKSWWIQFSTPRGINCVRNLTTALRHRCKSSYNFLHDLYCRSVRSTWYPWYYSLMKTTLGSQPNVAKRCPVLGHNWEFYKYFSSATSCRVSSLCHAGMLLLNSYYNTCSTQKKHSSTHKCSVRHKNMVRHKNARFDTKMPYPACISCHCHYQISPFLWEYFFPIPFKYFVFKNP